MVTEENEFDQNDCCGNGCANCILDIKIQKPTQDAAAGKQNIIANFCKFKLLTKTPHTTELAKEVYELHFTYSAAVTLQTTDFALNVPPGHHIMLRAPLQEVADKDGTKFLLRPYSPFCVDVTKMEFKILVDLKPSGLMSQYITGLNVDDEVEFRGPIGGAFNSSDYSEAGMILITQGVAIAPTLRIVASLLADENNLSRICHLICCSDLRHVYFRERLHEFGRFWNYKARIFLTRQRCGDCKENCTVKCEKFQQSLRYKELVLPRRLSSADLEEAATNSCGSGEKVFIICGTRSFQDSIVASIRDLELEVENIFLL